MSETDCDALLSQAEEPGSHEAGTLAWRPRQDPGRRVLRPESGAAGGQILDREGPWKTPPLGARAPGGSGGGAAAHRSGTPGVRQGARVRRAGTAEGWQWVGEEGLRHGPTGSDVRDEPQPCAGCGRGGAGRGAAEGVGRERLTDAEGGHPPAALHPVSPGERARSLQGLGPDEGVPQGAAARGPPATLWTGRAFPPQPQRWPRGREAGPEGGGAGGRAGPRALTGRCCTRSRRGGRSCPAPTPPRPR